MTTIVVNYFINHLTIAMSEHKQSNRIKWKYMQKVPIPSTIKQLLWDEQTVAPLEKIIMRVLQYGNYDEIKYIYGMYPEEVTEIVNRYTGLRRGVKFWVVYWNKLYGHTNN